jgi:hypothetical protein
VYSVTRNTVSGCECNLGNLMNTGSDMVIGAVCVLSWNSQSFLSKTQDQNRVHDEHDIDFKGSFAIL